MMHGYEFFSFSFFHNKNQDCEVMGNSSPQDFPTQYSDSAIIQNGNRELGRPYCRSVIGSASSIQEKVNPRRERFSDNAPAGTIK